MEFLRSVLEPAGNEVSQTISRQPFSGGIPVWIVYGGFCSREELRKRRWRVAVRRCLEYSETQRRRAEPPRSFRKTRSSCAIRFPGGLTLALCGVLRGSGRHGFEPRQENALPGVCESAGKLEVGDRLDRRQVQDFRGKRVRRSWRSAFALSGRGAGRAPSWGASATARFIFRFWRTCAARTFSWCRRAPSRWTITCWNCC